MSTHAPTSSADDVAVDSFYHELQETLKNILSRDITIIAGDFNAKVGNDPGGDSDLVWAGVCG